MRRGDRDAGENGDLREFMTHHVVKEDGRCTRPIHVGKMEAHSCKCLPHSGFALDIQVCPAAPSFMLAVTSPIDHSALAGPGPDRVEGNMRRHAGGPRREATGACEALSREGENDLFEGGLDEIIVGFIPAPEDPIESSFDDADQAVVQMLTSVPLAALERIDQIPVIQVTRARIRPAFDHAKMLSPSARSRFGGHFKQVVTEPRAVRQSRNVISEPEQSAEPRRVVGRDSMILHDNFDR